MESSPTQEAGTAVSSDQPDKEKHDVHALFQ